MIRNILLDLDDTILDFHASERNALCDTFHEFGITISESLLARYHEINMEEWEKLERQEITREQVLVERFERLFAEKGITADADMVQQSYETGLSFQHIFMPGAKEMLEQLSGKYRLYLASNGTAFVQERRITESGIRDYFSDFFISQNIGFDKPSLSYFNASFAKIPDFQKEETVIIGDSLTSDILGGVNAGIHTIWFNPRQLDNKLHLSVEYEIESLDEIASILENMS